MGSIHAQARKLLFLPGAKGDGSFWQPVSSRLVGFDNVELLSWPWFRSRVGPSDVESVHDLAEWVAARLDQPSALIAQSLGGVVALLVALRRPESVTRLVLTATSGGIPIADLGIADWRFAFFAANPNVPRWIADQRIDLSSRLHSVQVPTLLLWGDSDPISPVAVAIRLQSLIEHAERHVIPGGDHDLAVTHHTQVGRLIQRFLMAAPT